LSVVVAAAQALAVTHLKDSVTQTRLKDLRHKANSFEFQRLSWCYWTGTRLTYAFEIWLRRRECTSKLFKLADVGFPWQIFCACSSSFHPFFEILFRWARFSFVVACFWCVSICTR